MINNKVFKNLLLVSIITIFLTSCGGGGTSTDSSDVSSHKDNAQLSKVTLKDVLLESKETESKYQMLMFEDGKTLVLTKNEFYDISEKKLKKLLSLNVEGTFRGLSLDDKIFYSGESTYNYRTDLTTLKSTDEGKGLFIKEPVVGLLYIDKEGFPHYGDSDIKIFAISNDSKIIYKSDANIFKIVDATGALLSKREFRYDISNAPISKDKHFAYITERYTGITIADISDIHGTLPLVGQFEFEYADPEGSVLSTDEKTLYVWGVTDLYVIDVSDTKNPRLVKSIDTEDYYIRKFIPSVDDSKGYFLTEKNGSNHLLVIKL